MGVLLAAISAFTFGISDFVGGVSARRMPAVLTTVVGQLSGLVGLVVVGLVVTGDPTVADLTLGALAGAAGGLGLLTFYWALSRGQMSVVAPVSAVTGALVPVTVGLASGERPAALAVFGMAVGLPAIVLISREPTPREAESSATLVGAIDHLPTPPGLLRRLGGLPVVAAAGAGLGFGSFFAILSATTGTSGLWPLATARTTAIAVVLLVIVLATVRGHAPRPDRRGVALAAVAGVLDVSANVAFLLATRQGLLTLVGVVGAMYPASTVALARVVLGEHLARHQLLGLALAAAAVGVIAAA